MGVPTSKANEKTAQQKATQIELDIGSGNFDCILKKYKPQISARVPITVVELFKAFMVCKSKTVSERTLEKYAAVLSHLTKHFDAKTANTLTITDAEKFIDSLEKQGLSPVAVKTYLILVKSCWTWAVKQELVESNPWCEDTVRVKVPPKQMPNPFTREEIGAIIQAFRSDRYYSHYADYVEFLFGTGVRTGEAVGLQWKHLKDDCSSVWIGETLTRGVRKSTKTNRARTFSLTPKLQKMLLHRRSNSNPNQDDLVFPAPRGSAIDDCTFKSRVWKTVLTRLEIDYRKPSNTRHSLVSHALDLGMNPVSVAQLTGHDVRVLFDNYSGNVSGRPRLPEL